jgi:hypothetical protein
MGAMECDADAARHTVSCNTPRGAWSLTVNGDDMRGTLTSTDGTLYRRVHLTREKAAPSTTRGAS